VHDAYGFTVPASFSCCVTPPGAIRYAAPSFRYTHHSSTAICRRSPPIGLRELNAIPYYCDPYAKKLMRADKLNSSG
jgi:hypothetical protein